MLLRSFSTSWDRPDEAKPEYAWGMSILHDLKDHILHGLGFSNLTEFQTIVQTYYGASMSTLSEGKETFLDAIRTHIFHELYGLNGRPLVYSDCGQVGLLKMFNCELPSAEKEDIFAHVCIICECIILPRIMQAYTGRHEFFALLQTPAHLQHYIVMRLLPNLKWFDKERLYLRLVDNQNYHANVRAYICEELAEMTAEVSHEIEDYASCYSLSEKYPHIFSTHGYTL